jgi:hypothetical protein
VKSDLIDISVQFQHQTDAAVCVRAVEDGPDIWIPKSQCEILQTAPRRGHYILLTTDEATATDKGLV